MEHDPTCKNLECPVFLASLNYALSCLPASQAQLYRNYARIEREIPKLRAFVNEHLPPEHYSDWATYHPKKLKAAQKKVENEQRRLCMLHKRQLKLIGELCLQGLDWLLPD